MAIEINRRSIPEPFSLGKRLIIAWFISGPMGWILGLCLFRLSGVEGTTPPERIESTEKWFTNVAVISIFAAITLCGHIPFSSRTRNIVIGALVGSTISFLAVVIIYTLPEAWFATDPTEGLWASEQRQRNWANKLGFQSLPITLLVGSIAGLVYSFAFPEHKPNAPIPTENGQDAVIASEESSADNLDLHS